MGTAVFHEWAPGIRVVVRRRLPGGLLGDVVGDLVDVDQDSLTIRSRRGEVVVARSDVVAGKPVPPRPVRRGAAHRALSVQGMQEVMADGWRPVELERLGGWLLRASHGFTGRGNSALPLGDPGVSLEQALEAVRRFYTSRQLVPRVALAYPLGGPGRDPLGALLEAQGWPAETPTSVMTASAREVTGILAGPPTVPVDVQDEPDEAWLSLYRYRGQPLPPVAGRLLRSSPAQAFASVREGGSTVAVGRVAASRGWAGITAMQVATTHRRRGLARSVIAALADWAVRAGAPSLYLQVAEDNAAGLALYRSCGFTEHSGYRYHLGPGAAVDR